MDGATLPGAGEDTFDRRLQAPVLVGDRKTHSREPSGHQIAQELDPEGLCLGLADVDPDHLPAASLVNGIGDHQRLGAHAAAVSDLQVLGVQPQVGEGAFEWAVAEGVDPLVEFAAKGRDPVLAHRRDAQLLDQAIDLACRYSVDVGLHDHRDDRLLAGAAWLQEAREVGGAGALARHSQLDLPDPGLPEALPVAVSVCCPLGAPLAPGSADLAGNLGLHQLGGDHRHRVAQEVGVLGDQGLGDDLGGRHALLLGHRGAPSSVGIGPSTDESVARGGRNFVPATAGQLHHFYRRDPPCWEPSFC